MIGGLPVGLALLTGAGRRQLERLRGEMRGIAQDEAVSEADATVGPGADVVTLPTCPASPRC
ncbi:MAG: hypothetical protein NZ699_06945 [Roseiflexus sp.]|nr:hypothetical protein [Roseiflexus sp.]